MKDALILEQKTYISARRASQVFNYASDYIGQLCRAGKLDCKMVGRSWFVTEESLVNHRLSVKQESLKQEIPVTEPVSPEVKVEAKVETKNDIVDERVSLATPISVAPTVSTVEMPKVIHPLSVDTPVVFKTLEKKPSQTISSVGHFMAMTFVVGIFFIASLFLLQSMYFSSISKNNFAKTASASVVTSTIYIVDKVVSFFTSIPKFAINLFSQDSGKQIVTEIEKPPPVTFNGLAVVPSTNSAVQDEIIKERIRDSFSDEVQVKPDKSGASGIITPVFKKAKGDNFVYVLVPVSNQ